jgi:hypothetical protein
MVIALVPTTMALVHVSILVDTVSPLTAVVIAVFTSCASVALIVLHGLYRQDIRIKTHLMA